MVLSTTIRTRFIMVNALLEKQNETKLNIDVNLYRITTYQNYLSKKEAVLSNPTNLNPRISVRALPDHLRVHHI